jgi:hypothetical protein
LVFSQKESDAEDDRVVVVAGRRGNYPLCPKPLPPIR